MPQFDREARYLVELCAAALHGDPCPLPPDGCDFSALQTLITTHKLGAILYPLIHSDETLFSPQLQESVRQEFRKAQLRDLTQLDALEEICEDFTAAGLNFMPLKGLILKRYFRKSYERMMGDLDILIHPADRERAREILLSRGYEAKLYGELYDDVYYRRPILNLEIHHALGKDEHFPVPYFDCVWERSLCRADNSYWHEMSNADFYIYFMVHLAKHCRGHGTGIRSLIDLWVLLRSPLMDFDRAQVDLVLAEFGLLQFEKEFIRLSAVWFDGEPGDEFHDTMRKFLILDSGLYGNVENSFFGASIGNAKENAQKKKRHLFFRRVFPPYALMTKKYPILQTQKWLLPVFWILRDIRVILHPRKLRGEYDLYASVTRGMDTQSMIRKRLGFTALHSDNHGEKK